MTPTQIKLNDGTSIPTVGFGAGTALYQKESIDLIKEAYKNGYKYFDGAQQYGNSESIGTALQESSAKRDDVYILTKFGFDGAKPDQIDPRKVLQAELKKLQVDHVDLYLIHNPFVNPPISTMGMMYTGDKSLSETWAILESLVDEGLTKSIGVSNFREEDLLEISKTWKIPPAVNQIEYHPYVFHADNMERLVALQKKHDIKVEAYGPQTPLFRVPGGPVDKVVNRIAEETGLTPGQVLLLWAQEHTGGVVVTTSRDDGRQKEQIRAFDGRHGLTSAQVEEIAQAGREKFYRHFQHGVWDAAKP